ncbi:MAG: hypothetical protein RLZZ450_4030 [Pseudomonadota bacterium]
MDSQSFPVTVLVKRPDGTSESVRVGTAVRTDDGFRLSLGELSIGAAADPAAYRPRAASVPPGAVGDGPVFPPYGRSKGAPIAGASVQDLEYYISGSRRSLDDPSKARWHDKERVLLAAMEAELARKTGGGGAGPSSGGGYGNGGSYGNGGGQSAGDFEGAPSYSDDDDIPF